VSAAGLRNGTFHDRTDAGRELAAKLGAYRDDPSGLILALPRGGVVVGYEISLALNLPLDVFITQKLGAPDNPEYAIGAVAETGSIHLNQQALSTMGGFSTASRYFDEMIQAQREEIRRRQDLYRNGRPLPDMKDRTVLLVDDGVATGATFLASIEALRSLQVRRLVAALPVGPKETLNEIGKQVHDLIILATPEPFYAVGNHYLDFRQVSDDEVVRYLTEAAAVLARRPASRAQPARRPGDIEQ
jgi:putative phosphoribosyl transferase